MNKNCLIFMAYHYIFYTKSLTFSYRFCYDRVIMIKIITIPLLILIQTTSGKVVMILDSTPSTGCITFKSPNLRKQTPLMTNSGSYLMPSTNSYRAPRPQSQNNLKKSNSNSKSNSSNNSNKIRSFTSKGGQSFNGRLISINKIKKSAKIKNDKGSYFDIPINRFSSADIKYLKSWWLRRN